MTKKQIAALKATIGDLEHGASLAKIAVGGRSPERAVAYLSGTLRDVAAQLRELRAASRATSRTS